MASRPSFATRVAAAVARVPRGRVATYGQIAALAGAPRAARQVGWMLRHTFRALPWHRVINREGRLSIVHLYLTPAHQAALLRKEHVRLAKRGGAYWVDLQRYLWKPSARQRAGVV